MFGGNVAPLQPTDVAELFVPPWVATIALPLLATCRAVGVLVVWPHHLATAVNAEALRSGFESGDLVSLCVDMRN